MFAESIWNGAAQASTKSKQTDSNRSAVEAERHGAQTLLSTEHSTANATVPVNNRVRLSMPDSSAAAPIRPKLYVASTSQGVIPKSTTGPSGTIKLTVANPRVNNFSNGVDASGRPRMAAIPLTFNRIAVDRNGALLPKSNSLSTTKQILRTHIIRSPLVRSQAAPITVGNGALNGAPRFPQPLSARLPPPQTVSGPPVMNATSPGPGRPRQTPPSTPSSSQNVAKKRRARDWDAEVNRRDPPKECALCKRRLETNGGSAAAAVEYRHFEMVTTKQESKTPKSGASSAKRARKSSKSDSASDSDSSESGCEILMAESTVRVERCSLVCNDCETQFRDVTDAQTLPPCTCSVLSARRTRTADACDGHRVSCSRFRYERFCDLRNKRQEWRSEQPAPEPPALKPLPQKTPPASASPSVAVSPIKNAMDLHDNNKPANMLPDTVRIQQLPKLLKTGSRLPGPLSLTREIADRSKVDQFTVRAVVNGVPRAPADTPKTEQPASMIPPSLHRMVQVRPTHVLSRPISVVGATIHKVGTSPGVASACLPAAVGTPPFKIESIRPVMTTIVSRRPSSNSLELNAATKPPRSSEADDVVLMGEEQPARDAVQAQSTSKMTTSNVPTISPSPTATSQVRPRRVIRRYDTSKMRPVANFIFNIGLDLVKHYVANSDVKALKSETQNPPTTTNVTLPQTTCEKRNSCANLNDGPTNGSAEPVQATDSATTDPPPVIVIDSPSTSTTHTQSSPNEDPRLATALSALAECKSRIGHLCYTGLFRCKYCGFITESQLVFARHKLTGWLRWITETEAREIERRPTLRRERERDRKPRSRRGPNARKGRKARRGHDSSSSTSFEPSNRDSDSSSSGDEAARKRASTVEIHPTVQLVREEKDEKGNTIVHMNSEWGIGEEPADVFVGQCCACGFIATRCPRTYTSHLRVKHNIALSVDEATLSIARCHLCPFTLRYRNAVFKQHVRFKCPLRFDASTNQSPSSFNEELPFLLHGHRGSLLYEIIETEVDYDSITAATSRNKTNTTGNAIRIKTSVDVDALLDSVNRSRDPTLIPLDHSDVDSGEGSPTAGSRSQQAGVVTIVPVRPTNLVPKNSLRLITASHTLSDSNKSNGSHSPVDTKRIELSNDGKVPAVINRQDFSTQICIFCCKQLRPGINPFQHFTGGHLISMRLQIRQRMCPFCSIPTSACRPMLRFSSTSALQEHIISMHDFHSAFWWPYVIAALHEHGANATALDVNAIIRSNQGSGDVENPAQSNTDTGRQASTECYCAFCSQSVGTEWNARKHFVDRHLTVVRNKMRQYVCPLCCLPYSPETAGSRPLQFSDVVALQNHIERSHRFLCRAGSNIWWPFIQAELNRIRNTITINSPNADLPKLKVIKPANSEPPLAKLIDPQTRTLPNSHAKSAERCSFCSQTITIDANKHFVNEHLTSVGTQISKLECPICTLLESEQADSHFPDMAALIRHVTVIHQVRYRSALWWPFISNALSTAAKSSVQAKTNGAALAGPSGSSATARIPHIVTGASHAPGRVTSKDPAPGNRFVIIDSGNTRCLFCSKTVTSNLLHHFSENHLSMLRAHVRNRQCPLCALPTNADSGTLHCYADHVKLQAHIESAHGQHQKSFWWPYLATALLAVARTKTSTEPKASNQVHVKVELESSEATAEADKAEAGVEADNAEAGAEAFNAEADPEAEAEVDIKDDDESEVEVGADSETGAEADTEAIDADAEADSESDSKADTGANSALQSNRPASISSDSRSVIDCDSSNSNDESMEIID